MFANGYTNRGRLVHAVYRDDEDYNSVALCGVNCSTVDRAMDFETGTDGNCRTCDRLATNLPPGFDEQANGELVCPHRSMSCCDDCVATWAPNVVEVEGAHFWLSDPADRAALESFVDETTAMYADSTTGEG
jgi:hypothetical protein